MSQYLRSSNECAYCNRKDYEGYLDHDFTCEHKINRCQECSRKYGRTSAPCGDNYYYLYNYDVWDNKYCIYCLILGRNIHVIKRDIIFDIIPKKYNFYKCAFNDGFNKNISFLETEHFSKNKILLENIIDRRNNDPERVIYLFRTFYERYFENGKQSKIYNQIENENISLKEELKIMKLEKYTNLPDDIITIILDF